MYRSSPSEVVLGKGVLKIYLKCTKEHPCWSAISIKLLCNFIEIALRHRYSPVILLHIFRTSFPKNTSGVLLLNVKHVDSYCCYKKVNLLPEHGRNLIFAPCAKAAMTSKSRNNFILLILQNKIYNTDLLQGSLYTKNRTELQLFITGCFCLLDW